MRNWFRRTTQADALSKKDAEALLASLAFTKKALAGMSAAATQYKIALQQIAFQPVYPDSPPALKTSIDIALKALDDSKLWEDAR
jgi:hypothetical protein